MPGDSLQGSNQCKAETRRAKLRQKPSEIPTFFNRCPGTCQDIADCSGTNLA
jgi:hypothetical protein